MNTKQMIEAAISMQWCAAKNPYLAARIAGGIRDPAPKTEKIVWTDGAGVQHAQLAIFRALSHIPHGLRAVLVARFGENLTLQQYGDRIAGASA